jgi:selenocysteine lyase/cysteine desulfurase
VIPPPTIEERPDVSAEALEDRSAGFLYCNVAGSGRPFPIVRRVAQEFRGWLDAVGMFSPAGIEAYDATLAGARSAIARALGDEGGGCRVALAQSATDALNTAIAGIRAAPGALLVTSAEEHASALLPLYRRRELGDRLRILPYHDDSSFLRALEVALREGAVALVLSLVSYRSGKVLPAPAACRLARAAGAVAIVDAAQALGQIPVSAQELGAHAVIVLGHKWVHGPLGTGAMWVADVERFACTRLGWRSRISHDLEGGMRLHEDAARFEAGTVDAAAFVGFHQALVVHRALGGAVATRIRALRRRLLERLSELPYDVVSRAEDPTGIVTVTPRTADAAGIVTRMWLEEGIAVKHVQEPGASDAIRISFWALHREAEIGRVADALARHAEAPAPAR